MPRSPVFLDLPDRRQKPRDGGITHVLDTAIPLRLLECYLESTSHLVDIVKVGWGLSYVDPSHPARLELCRRYGVHASTGGTLLEIVEAQGRLEAFVDWALSTGVDLVEVSNGLGMLSRQRKSALIERLSRDFVVVAETGSKDQRTVADPELWVTEMKADLDCGAKHVIAEGRESGTVGLYGDDGDVRVEVFDAIVASVPIDRVIFEAPRKPQQTWLIRHLGPEVNLGNIALHDVLPLETLRLGLRADTVAVHGAAIG
ncbi:MAG TPA: phosphohydrolase [Nocardioides bacterium]|nr:phosphohydrolase [Nocardioides sp.]